MSTPTSTATGELSALTAATSQQVFAAVLSALAHPGRPADLGEAARDHLAGTGVVPAALPVLALTDLMTPVAELGDGVLLRRLTEVTGAPRAAVERARFVVAGRLPDPVELGRLHRGTDLAPSTAALLCVQVGLLPVDSARLRISGPGVPGRRTLDVPGVDADWLAARAEACAAFPRGVDIVFVDERCQCLGWPRTATVELSDDGSGRPGGGAR